MDKPTRRAARRDERRGELKVTTSLTFAAGGIAGPSEEIRALRMSIDRKLREMAVIRAALLDVLGSESSA
jgi:hypothetical protein